MAISNLVNYMLQSAVKYLDQVYTWYILIVAISREKFLSGLHLTYFDSKM